MTVSDMHLGAKPILFERAKQMRHEMTKAEQLFWSAINKKQLGIKFRNQHPLMFFIADFYCHELKLLIEIDGGYHKRDDQFKYDENRGAELGEWNIKVVRCSNEEIEKDLPSAINRLKRIILEEKANR